MKHFIPLLILCFSISSCLRNNTINSGKKNVSWLITVSSSNLSEDATILSSKDDELMLFVYSKLDNVAPSLLAQKSFVFDTDTTYKLIPLNTKRLSDEKVIVVLIEMDSEQTIIQIEPIVRINLQKILDNFYEEDQTPTRELLGDNDILGIERISLRELKQGRPLLFNGINLFDAFAYKISLTENND